MATAFTEQELNIISAKLKDAARHCAGTFGVRKTTVDQLAAAADISKGTFYKFYPSKEALFFELLEEMQVKNCRNNGWRELIMGQELTALYERLSHDDELQGESNSISNHYSILKELLRLR